MKAAEKYYYVWSTLYYYNVRIAMYAYNVRVQTTIQKNEKTLKILPVPTS